MIVVQAPKELSDFSNELLQKDDAIRFVGIANVMGSLLSTVYRPGLVPLNSPEETARYAVQAAIRAATREDFQANVGETIYSIARYTKLVRATIPIGIKEKRHLLLVSFDIDCDAEKIINQIVLPFITKNKRLFQ